MGSEIVVGIDIGGTKIAAAAVSARGEVLCQAEMPTQAERGFDDGLRRIVALVERVLAGYAHPHSTLAAIGIGCAGPVNPVTGTIDNPYTLPTWDGVDILSPLRIAYGVPAAIENDADVAAMGECWLGAGRGGGVVVMVTVGTGVGGGVILDGQVYRGVDGAHPEIGHLALDATGPACYCGVRGCWESLASGPAMAAAYCERASVHDTKVTGASVVARARSGDPVAQAVIARAAQATARGIFSLVNLYVPEIVVLGGGVMAAYDLFEPAIREVIARNTMAPVHRIAVRKAALGSNAGILGAARVALDLL